MRSDARPANGQTPDAIRLDLLATLEQMLRLITRGRDPFEFSNEARLQLDSLPLDTEDYGLAINRLNNANRYLSLRERGAACVELRLLAGSLRNGKSWNSAPTRRVTSGSPR